MTRTNNKILVFQWFLIVVITLKTTYGLIVFDDYDLRLLFSILFVDFIISVIFMFALCKINRIAKKQMIDLKNWYIIMHFVCIWVLIIHWTIDSVFYIKA